MYIMYILCAVWNKDYKKVNCNHQVNSTRLHKDINNYLRCIRGQFPQYILIDWTS